MFGASIVTSIFSLFMGGLPAITREIANAKIQLAQTDNEAEKIRIQERIRTLEVRADALARQQSNPWTIVAQFLFVAPIAVYWFQITAWDKVMCKWFVAAERVADVCSTDPLSDMQEKTFWIIVTFYFAGQIIDKAKR